MLSVDSVWRIMSTNSDRNLPHNPNWVPCAPPPAPKPRVPVERDAEFDPTGLSLNTPGAKADANKLRPTLVIRDMAMALRAVIKIATDGAEKYSPGGWLKVVNSAERYDDADLRHMLSRYIDGPIDKDSLSLHLAHEAWNALAKLELHLRSTSTTGTT